MTALRGDQLALALSDSEQDRLWECEEVIGRGLQTFVEVGEALLTIRDGRLYRAEHRTFEGYCRQRWGFSHQRASQLTQAAEVATIVAGHELPPPANEAQARELAPLRDEPERMAEAWQEVVETASEGKVTADHVREVVREYRQQQAEDREFVQRHQPPGFDAAADGELVRQRGALSRLTEDIVSLGEPSQFARSHRDWLRDTHISRAEAAAAWLDDFLAAWREP